MRSRRAVLRSSSSSQCTIGRVDGFGAAEAEGRSHGVEAADQVRAHGEPHGDGVCVSQHVSALNTRSGMGPILECYRTEIPGALPRPRTLSSPK